jgi:hypothetical protein
VVRRGLSTILYDTVVSCAGKLFTVSRMMNIQQPLVEMCLARTMNNVLRRLFEAISTNSVTKTFKMSQYNVNMQYYRPTF